MNFSSIDSQSGINLALTKPWNAYIWHGRSTMVHENYQVVCRIAFASFLYS
jgi:hypothetical protein